MTLYRKKLEAIEARQVTEANIVELSEWAGGNVKGEKISFPINEDRERYLEARAGDWIFREDGNFFSCSASIFAANFEELTDTATVDHMRDAAPDLVEALTDALDMLESELPNPYPVGMGTGIPERIAAIRAALAKAGGE